MHLLTQQDLELKLRRPHLNRFKRRLVEALQNPALPADHRKVLQHRLKNLGKPRLYRADDPQPAGAVNPGPIPRQASEQSFSIDDLSRDHLSTLPHFHLVGYAKAAGLDTKVLRTKAQLISALERKQS